MFSWVMLFRSILFGICPQKGWLAQPRLTSLLKKKKILHAHFSLGFTFTFTITPKIQISRLSLSLNFSHPSHPPPHNWTQLLQPLPPPKSYTHVLWSANPNLVSPSLPNDRPLQSSAPATTKQQRRCPPCPFPL